MQDSEFKNLTQTILSKNYVKNIPLITKIKRKAIFEKSGKNLDLEFINKSNITLNSLIDEKIIFFQKSISQFETKNDQQSKKIVDGLKSIIQELNVLKSKIK